MLSPSQGNNGNLRRYGICAGMAAAIPTIWWAISMAYSNKDAIIRGTDTAMKIKDCVMDNKMKFERDNCFQAISYLQNNVSDLRALNVSNKAETSELLAKLAADVRDSELAEQLFDDLNFRTKAIWDNAHSDVRNELQKRVSPFELSLQNIPKSTGDMVLWVNEAARCNEDHRACIKARDEAKIEAKRAKDEIINLQKEFKAETDPLKERKGECKELEKIKEQLEHSKSKNGECDKEKFELEKSILKLQMERDNWKSKYEETQKQKWF